MSDQKFSVNDLLTKFSDLAYRWAESKLSLDNSMNKQPSSPEDTKSLAQTDYLPYVMIAGAFIVAILLLRK